MVVGSVSVWLYLVSVSVWLLVEYQSGFLVVYLCGCWRSISVVVGSISVGLLVMHQCVICLVVVGVVT